MTTSHQPQDRYWGTWAGDPGERNGSPGGRVWHPLEFGVVTANWPSSQVAVSQVCVWGGGSACLGWLLAGVSVGRAKVGGWQLLPGLVSISTVALWPARSFQLLPPSPWGDIWQHPSSRRASGRTALPSVLPLPEMTSSHPSPCSDLSLPHFWSLRTPSS